MQGLKLRLHLPPTACGSRNQLGPHRPCGTHTNSKNGQNVNWQRNSGQYVTQRNPWSLSWENLESTRTQKPAKALEWEKRHFHHLSSSQAFPGCLLWVSPGIPGPLPLPREMTGLESTMCHPLYLLLLPQKSRSLHRAPGGSQPTGSDFCMVLKATEAS